MGRDRFCVIRVRLPGIRQAVDAVQGGLTDRQLRRIDHHSLSIVPLDKSASIERIRLIVYQPRGLGERRFVVTDLFVAWQYQGIRGWRLRRAQGVGHSAQVAQVTQRLTVRQPLCDLDNGGLPHPEDDQVGFGVQQDRAAHLVTPIVVVSQSAQGRLHASRHDRHAFEGLSRPLTIGQRRPIGTQANATARGVGVVVAHFAVCSVVIDHRVHVAGADAQQQPGSPEAAPVVGRTPVGLADDAHTKPGCLQHATDDCHGEAGMVDVGISRDHDHVQLVPTPCLHLVARGGQRTQVTVAFGLQPPHQLVHPLGRHTQDRQFGFRAGR